MEIILATTEPSRAQVQQNAAQLTATFAKILFVLGRGEQIRTLEAIAATLANQVKASTGCATGGDRVETAVEDAGAARLRHFAHHLAALTAVDGAQRDAIEDHPAYASCLRIARRAMAAAIQDPTGGATRFHAIDEAPDWARGMLPNATLGGFVFYRDDGSLLGISVGADRSGEKMGASVLDRADCHCTDKAHCCATRVEYCEYHPNRRRICPLNAKCCG